jgi:glycosyltransferase involved in cell wall biosynthesis
MISGSKIVVVDNPGTWSDTPHYCVGALRREIENVIVVGTLDDEQRRPFMEQMKEHYDRTGRKYLPERDFANLRERAETINETVKLHPDADAVVVFHPPDAVFLETDSPIAIIHDSTWHQLTSTYPGYLQSDLSEESYQSGFALERIAFDKANWLLFMSEWAADAARNEYPALTHKIRVLYPGANLPEAPESAVIHQAIEGRTNGQCRVLFVGYAGWRKGIDIAIGTVECLLASGMDAVLQVVGVKGEAFFSSSAVRWHGPLSKFASAEFTLLNQFYRESFVMVLPSRAECAGIVLCEAAAFGLPAIVPKVGGMSELVTNGNTGYVLAAMAEPSEYAAAIAGLWHDPAGYREQCANARARYQDVLNWDQTARNLGKLVYNGR